MPTLGSIKVVFLCKHCFGIFDNRRTLGSGLGFRLQLYSFDMRITHSVRGFACVSLRRIEKNMRQRHSSMLDVRSCSVIPRDHRSCTAAMCQCSASAAPVQRQCSASGERVVRMPAGQSRTQSLRVVTATSVALLCRLLAR